MYEKVNNVDTRDHPECVPVLVSLFVQCFRRETFRVSGRRGKNVRERVRGVGSRSPPTSTTDPGFY